MHKSVKEIFLNCDKNIDITDEEKNYIHELFAIDMFTILLHKKIIKKLLKKYLKRKYKCDLDIIKFDEESQKYYVELSNGRKIRFLLMSDNMETKDKSIIRELESYKRKGQCHSRAFDVSIAFDEANILTGIANVGNRQFLHSVVETKNSKGELICLDWTRNIMMPKEDYIELFNFKILSSLDKNDMKNDFDIVRDLEFTTKHYLLFRDEIMRDINKNKELFENKVL